jgi:hypothetical protein
MDLDIVRAVALATAIFIGSLVVVHFVVNW